MRSSAGVWPLLLTAGAVVLTVATLVVKSFVERPTLRPDPEMRLTKGWNLFDVPDPQAACDRLNTEEWQRALAKRLVEEFPEYRSASQCTLDLEARTTGPTQIYVNVVLRGLNGYQRTILPWAERHGRTSDPELNRRIDTTNRALKDKMVELVRSIAFEGGLP